MLKIIGLDNFKVSLLINRISEKKKLPNSNKQNKKWNNKI